MKDFKRKMLRTKTSFLYVLAFKFNGLVKFLSRSFSACDGKGEDIVRGVGKRGIGLGFRWKKSTLWRPAFQRVGLECLKD